MAESEAKENASKAKAQEVGLLNTQMDDAIPAPLLFSCRLHLALIGFLMFFHLYAQRVGMSIAIVSMVNQTAVRQLQLQAADLEAAQSKSISFSNSSLNGSSYDVSLVSNEGQCKPLEVSGNATRRDGPFVWEKEIQGHILGAFFYGYMVSQIPGGLLAERYGAKWVITIFMGLSTIATLLTPVAAHVSFIFLIFLRVLCGIGSGALFPAMHAMLGQWAPPLERAKLCGLLYAGTFMGNVIAMPVSGLLCEYGFAEGWGSVFYVFGLTSVVTIIGWIFLTSNTPSDHPRISKVERDYIVTSLMGQMSEVKPKFSEMPWFKILTSGAVWAIIIANFCVDWGLYTYLTNIPTFYSEVLFFDIQSNGFLSALPFLGLWAAMTICPLLAGRLEKNKKVGTAAARKLFNSIGMFGAGIALIGLSFLDCTKPALAVVLLISAVTVSGCVYSGYFVNHMDIAPQYAGTLMGIANGIGATSGFIAPYIASVITKSQTRESWQIVFFIAAAVYAIGGILFCILAKGTIQPWAKDKESVELDFIDTEKKRANGDDEHAGDGDSNRTPIYKPKAGSNGELAAEPMLSTKEV